MNWNTRWKSYVIFGNPGMQKLQSNFKGTKDFIIWVKRIQQQYQELQPLFSIISLESNVSNMPDQLVMPAVKTVTLET